MRIAEVAVSILKSASAPALALFLAFPSTLQAQDLTPPSDPVAAIEGEWKGIWNDWAVQITNGRVVLTAADPDQYSYLPVGTVLGQLDANGRVDGRSYRFTGSSCLDHRASLAPSDYRVIPCDDYGAGLMVFADAYHLNVSGLSFGRPRDASPPDTSEDMNRKGTTADASAEGAAPQDARRDDAAEELARREEANREADRAAIEETARLNKEIAEFAAQQAEDNRKAAEARVEYEREMERVQQARSDYEQSVEAHRREVDEANRRQQEYFAAQRRHSLCINGDSQACADIEAGKPALTGEPKLAEASTETDATRCVASPVISADPAFRNSTQAVVVNGCEAPVDVRVCLMRTGGWNCAVAWNLAPQASWKHTSFESDGQVFWDARVSTSRRPLASP